MNDKLTLGLLVVAGFVGTIITAPVLATTIESFLVIESARVNFLNFAGNETATSAR